MRSLASRIQHLLTTLVLSLLLWFVPGLTESSSAQTPFQNAATTSSTEQPAASPGIDPSNISSEKINQFVQACLQVVALIERREGELQGSETESESRRIEQEIEAEALAIIEQTGLTHQEYLQLLGLANTDPEFGERIAIQLQEATR